MRTNSIFSKIYWQALMILVEASIFRQHKNSFLGAAWGLVQPFVHIVIISYVFSFLLKQPAELMVKNLVASLPLWSFITSSVYASTRSFIERSMILKKVYMPKTLLPITDIMVHCYTLIYSFIAMYFAYIIFYPANFSLTIFLAPIAAIPVILSVISVGIMLAYMTPYIMDIPQMSMVILNAIYWALPIVYPYSIVPEDKKWLFEINPLFHLMRPIQVLINENSFPSMLIMIKAGAVTAILILLMVYVVRKLGRNVVYYL